MKLHSLYVANRQSGPWTDADQREVFDLITPIFPGFTVIEAKGFYQGTATPTLVISIATDDTEAVQALGERIRVCFDQIAIGLAYDGGYCRLMKQ